MLEGAAILFQVVGCKTILVETSLAEVDFKYFEDTKQTKFNSKNPSLLFLGMNVKLK